MKIAFLTPEYPHQNTGSSGGIGTSIKNLAEALSQLGHKVHILVYAQSLDKVFEHKNISIHQIKNRKFKGLSWWLTRKKLEKYVNELYAKNKIDIVEAQDWTGITSFIQPKKCPVIIKLHGSDTYFCKLEGRYLKKKNFYHEKRSLQKADGHLSVSQFTADKTNEFFKLNINFTIIPNGIDTGYFKPKEVKQTSAKKIIYLGTLIRKKGVLDLPHIFNQVIDEEPEAELILIGSDAQDIKTGENSTWKLMQGLFSEAALRQTRYKGKVPYDEVQSYIRETDVCVFPSYAEALPVSWLEAMAMQKAVVASNIGWGSEVIEDGISGLLVHPSNHKKFADTIIRILKDKNLKTYLEQNARKRILDKFDSKLIAKKSIDYYNYIIDEKKIKK
ncbi:glycosyltransferase family 4 protein [Psychroflexus sp. CAK57W]|uniref:glycosyltransferase family 4 protein n=1 Tax=Psychroflexus curvus TaxID=2873595 RepID=UPI001CCBD888|nr:glycosyltransferase family 4 protein [Psychroflexus curvus]MBZ9787825.1 glycosyltransferase family 4 protein [Psychroflexus curvus]